jgi:hypothetical protein
MKIQGIDGFCDNLKKAVKELHQAFGVEENSDPTKDDLHLVAIINIPGKGMELVTCGGFQAQLKEYKIGLMHMATHVATTGELENTLQTGGNSAIGALLNALGKAKAE